MTRWRSLKPLHLLNNQCELNRKHIKILQPFFWFFKFCFMHTMHNKNDCYLNWERHKRAPTWHMHMKMKPDDGAFIVIGSIKRVKIRINRLKCDHINKKPIKKRSLQSQCWAINYVKSFHVQKFNFLWMSLTLQLSERWMVGHFGVVKMRNEAHVLMGSVFLVSMKFNRFLTGNSNQITINAHWPQRPFEPPLKSHILITKNCLNSTIPNVRKLKWF